MRAGEDVVLEVRCDGQLAAVEGGVAEAVDAFVGVDAEGDEVAVGGADDEFGGGDFHGLSESTAS